jgi:hypothetical protein
VPKCEIFDRSDFPDFDTIKSLREGVFVVKKRRKKIFRGSFEATTRRKNVNETTISILQRNSFLCKYKEGANA